MIQIRCFQFNPIQENTYVLFNEKKQCIIVDAGCYFEEEKNELLNFVLENNLQPTLLLNTHAHFDHVFGISFLKNKFPSVPFVLHQNEKVVLDSFAAVTAKYGIAGDVPPDADYFIDEKSELKLGDEKIKILFTPGHSLGSLSFYFEPENMVVSGDVLFQQSIGRTDIMGGDFSTLVQSIHDKLFTLPDETQVYSGHGAVTTIGEEKDFNPFVGKNA